MNWRWPWRKDRGHSISLGELKWDVHSHVVPGVDDGAPDMEAALEMVRGMHDLGYSGMVVTPHIMSDLYPNRRKTLEPPFEALQLAVKAEGIEMQLRLAAEYLLDQELLENISKNDVMSFPCIEIPSGIQRTMLLIEFGFHHPPEEALVKEVMFAAQTRGLTPLLAHCERYPYLHDDPNLLETWHSRGGWMSVNAASLAGAYGPAVRDMAKQCMDRGWVSFLCSDAHGMRHVKALEALQTSQTVARWMNSDSPQHLGLGPH